VIQRTFQFIPGVGPFLEKDLWARGIRDWSLFPDAGPAVLGGKKDAVARNLIRRATESLGRGDLADLVALFPPREHWRLYGAFESDAVFFDIETDGGDPQLPTVVGLFSARAGLELFIDGENMDALPAALAAHRLWVTFNGSLFDVPVLARHFGVAFPKPALHLDLRFILQRLGFRGGLKRIEESLGLGRPAHLKGVGGAAAVVLWREYRETRRKDVLRFLVEYNLYDAFQLRTLMDLAWNLATEFTGDLGERRVPFDRVSVLPALEALLESVSRTPFTAELLEGILATSTVPDLTKRSTREEHP
jgi:uncharacterized protein YprB with RNaseH-like and TPR domain